MKIDTVTKTYDPNTGNLTGYRVTLENSTDVVLVPIATDNTDYQAIQKWIADGGTVIDNGGGE